MMVMQPVPEISADDFALQRVGEHESCGYLVRYGVLPAPAAAVTAAPAQALNPAPAR
ncbi:hypothetical protein ACFWH1_23105 [Streptomyces sp. NPDC127037]|uniref:hypothetical protein n=1 Tax=Streptomyces sp. NPDC127037 TaxID=3347113 RepID=UPI003647E119